MTASPQEKSATRVRLPQRRGRCLWQLSQDGAKDLNSCARVFTDHLLCSNKKPAAACELQPGEDEQGLN
jgi:hypothetical protein